MPEASVNGATIHYDQQGSGEPLILIPYLSADHACYAFQVPSFAERFCCYPVDLRGTGASGAGRTPYTVASFAEDIAAFMQALGLQKAHIFGLSLGGAVGMRFAAAYPDKLLSLSLHSTWPSTDRYVRTVVEGWQCVAEALDDVAETVIKSILPWCLTPEFYEAKPDVVESLGEFVRGRPKQSVSSFMEHSRAVIAHDALDELARIEAPTLVTFGAKDAVTSTRFAGPLIDGIGNAELEVFDGCSHAPIYENVEGFNARSLEFLTRNSGRI